MEPPHYFFVIFMLTIVITRAFVYFYRRPCPTVRGFRIHHYMYGIVLVLTGALLGTITLYAIGFGLFIDEIGYLLINGKTRKDNYSWPSFLIIGIFIVIVYFLKSHILFWR